MSPATTGPRPDIDQLHRAVVEVFDGLRGVVFIPIPTPQRLSGSDPADMLRRLDRLRAALTRFPDKRVTPDPFVHPRPVQLRFPAAGPRVRPPDPVTGTSTHDAVVRLAWRVYDATGVIPTREYTDPATGRIFRGVVNDNVIETADGVIIGPPAGVHYTAVEWTDEVADAVFRGLCADAHGFYCSDYFAPHPGTLRTALDHEVELARAARMTSGAPAATADGLRPAPRRSGSGKNIDARMLKVLTEDPQSAGWTATEWAAHLSCSPGTVKETKTWKVHLKAVRAHLAADGPARMETKGAARGRRMPPAGGR